MEWSDMKTTTIDSLQVKEFVYSNTTYKYALQQDQWWSAITNCDCKGSWVEERWLFYTLWDLDMHNAIQAWVHPNLQASKDAMMPQKNILHTWLELYLLESDRVKI